MPAALRLRIATGNPEAWDAFFELLRFRTLSGGAKN
jgi:hypothetical protein